jgi:hypothetical protein
MPVAMLRLKAEQAGIGWRTVESVKRRLGVVATKVGSSWEWSLPLNGRSESRHPAEQLRRAPDPRPDDPARVLDTLAAFVGCDLPELVEGLRRLTTTVPTSGPAARVQDPAERLRRLVDLRSCRGKATWGPDHGRVLVRCIDCQHGEEIRNDGNCPRSGLTVRWPYARRSCEAFQQWGSE